MNLPFRAAGNAFALNSEEVHDILKGNTRNQLQKEQNKNGKE